MDKCIFLQTEYYSAIKSINIQIHAVTSMNPDILHYMKEASGEPRWQRR